MPEQKEQVMSTQEVEAPKIEVATASEVEEYSATKALENPKSNRDVIEAKRKQDERLVRGTFVYRAKPGGRYRTALRKYKKDPNAKNAQGFFKLDMIDGKTYTIPYWIAEWLNGEADLSCADLKHDASNINLVEEGRAPPERIPVFRFIIQDYV